MTGVQSSRRGWIVLGACAIFFLLVAIAHSSEDGSAATLVVPDSYPTIQGAINNAKDGDVVDVRRGTYDERITIDRSITLKGANVGPTMITSSSSGAILTLEHADIRVTNIEIEGTSANTGIYGSELEGCQIVDVIVRGCGYGIHIDLGSHLEIERTSVNGCSNAALVVEGDIVESSLYVPPKATEAERPAWLAPVMVVVVIAAVLVGYVYARKRFGGE